MANHGDNAFIFEYLFNYCIITVPPKMVSPEKMSVLENFPSTAGCLSYKKMIFPFKICVIEIRMIRALIELHFYSDQKVVLLFNIRV